MGDQRSVQRLLPPLLLLTLLARMSQLWAFPFSPSLDLDVTPRTTVFSKGEGKHTFRWQVNERNMLHRREVRY